LFNQHFNQKKIASFVKVTIRINIIIVGTIMISETW
jgi:hypothetical protein